ncbi:MAG: CoA transferase [Panacagrimonas sp.]
MFRPSRLHSPRPLCGQLLRRAGADVVKLESRQRPDGARHGPAALFQRLNQDKFCVQLDFESTAGRRALHQPVAAADVLIEASRPRALQQLGIDAEHWLDNAAGRTWIRIRGYSAEEDPDGMGVAFGDDAGVAAGLSHLMATHGAHWLVGDAIGDPLTGLHAAVAGYALSQQGGGLVDVALTDTLRYATNFAALPSPAEWTALMRAAPSPATWPRGIIPHPGAPQRAADADKLEVFARWFG